jgi:hypothetical protein
MSKRAPKSATSSSPSRHNAKRRWETSGVFNRRRRTRKKFGGGGENHVSAYGFAPSFVAVTATAAQRKKVLAVAAERMATPVQRSHNQRSASSFTFLE